LRRKILWSFCCLTLFSFLVIGCDKKKTPTRKKGEKYITRGDLKKRVRFSKPRCFQMCRKITKVCAKRIKEKGNKFKLKSCAKECVKNFILYPPSTFRRMRCIMSAQTCTHLRNCNKCAFYFCKKEGKKWVPAPPPRGFKLKNPAPKKGDKDTKKGDKDVKKGDKDVKKDVKGTQKDTKAANKPAPKKPSKPAARK